MSAADTTSTRLGLWLPLAMMTLVQTITTMSTLTMAATAPEVARTLGLPTVVIGYQVSLIYLAGIATSLIGGALVRRFGACLISQAALALTVAGCLLLASASIAAAIVGSLVIGLGYGMTNPAASHLLSRAAGSRLNLVFSIKQTGVPLGGVLAGAMMPQIALAAGWQWALVTAGAVAGVVALAMECVRPLWDSDRDPAYKLSQRPLETVSLVLGDPVLRWLAIATFGYSFVQLSVVTFLVTSLVEDAGLSLVTAGLVLSVTLTAGVIGRIGWGWFADWIGDSAATLRILGGLMVLTALATSLIDASWPVWLIGLVFVIFGATAIAWNGVFLAAVARASKPGQVGQATGGSLSLAFAGVMAGPASFAAVHSILDISYVQTYGLLALVVGASLFCLWRAKRAQRSLA